MLESGGRIWRHHLSTVDEPTVDEVRRAIARDREHQQLHAEAKQAERDAALAQVERNERIGLSVEQVAEVQQTFVAARERRRAEAERAQKEERDYKFELQRRAEAFRMAAQQEREQREEVARERQRNAEARRKAEVEDILRRIAVDDEKQQGKREAAEIERRRIRAERVARYGQRQPQEEVLDQVEDAPVEEAPAAAPAPPVDEDDFVPVAAPPLASDEMLDGEADADADAALQREAALMEWKASHPCLVRISGIAASGLPDADKKGGSGTSDPYVRFRIGETAVRTPTQQNAKNPTWDDVFEIEVPFDVLNAGDENLQQMKASVIDDDENDDGRNADDPMGSVTVDLSGDGGTFDQYIDGHGQLHGFRLKFAYELIRPEIPEDLVA